jgi:SIR2-like domain
VSPATSTGEKGMLERDLRQEVERARVVAVVGAGVSVGATRRNPISSWVGLLDDGISRCEQLYLTLPDGWGDALRAKLRSGRVEDLLAAADEVGASLGAPSGGEYRRWLRETVGALEVRDASVIEALRDLQIPIATTNYDSLIEDVTGLEPVTWRDDARMVRVLRRDEAGILHLHGHWEDPDSVVLGVRSYRDVLGDVHAQFLQQAITAFNSLLFVGCGEGLKDPNFGALRRWLAQFAGWEYRHFRLALQSEARAVAAEHVASERIAVIPYGSRHEDLAPFLRGLRPTGPRPRPEPSERAGPSSWLRRHLRLVAAGAGLLVAAAVLAALLIPGGGDGGLSPPTRIAVGYAGTSRIGKSGEIDAYSFGGKGRTVSLVSQPVAESCPGFGTVGWKLVEEASGETVFDRWMLCDEPFGPLGYRLKRGPYTLTVYGKEGATGDYRFALLPIAEQHFSIAVGDTVRDGEPKPGAGELAEPGELDVYSFRGEGKTMSPISQQVAGSCPSFGTIGWKLVHEASGETVFDRWMLCSEPFGPFGQTLKRGAYTLTVYGSKGVTGPYRFTLLLVTEQRFSIAVGDTVRDGEPRPGAGELAEPGELDVYSFGGKGRTVRLVSQPVAGSCPSFGTIGWKLVEEASGETVFDRWMLCGEPFGDEGYRLKAGGYTLIVYAAEGGTGRYRFSLRGVASS